MDNMTRNDMVLTGNGTAPGGMYKLVKIVGEQDVNGDLDCIKLKIVGTTDINGNVKVESGTLTGTSNIRGNFEIGQFKIVGTVDVHGNTSAKELIIHGEVKVEGNMLLEKADISGFLNVQGDCTGETLVLKGPLKIGGLLNAENIDVDLHCCCHIKEIGGERINIKRGSDALIKKLIKSMYLPSDYYTGKLITDSVEGDDIYLEYTTAKVVRGNNVKIGPGCVIDLVEYKDNFEQAEETDVKQYVKV